MRPDLRQTLPSSRETAHRSAGHRARKFTHAHTIRPAVRSSRHSCSASVAPPPNVLCITPLYEKLPVASLHLRSLLVCRVDGWLECQERGVCTRHGVGVD